VWLAILKYVIIQNYNVAFFKGTIHVRMCRFGQRLLHFDSFVNDTTKLISRPHCCFDPGLQCEAGKEYDECGTTCTSECWSETEDEGCSSTCVEGCHCPNGTVLYDGQCIERLQCPCKVGSMVIPTGQVIPFNCMQW